MPWCPICKNEYKEGFTHCNDCDVDLVDSLEDGPKAIMFGSESDMEEMKKLIVEAGIVETAFIAFDEKDKCYELYVAPDQAEEAKAYLQNHMEAETEQVLMEEFGVSAEALSEDDNLAAAAMLQASEEAAEEKKRDKKVYVDKKAKAEDYKSSAYVLLLVGGLGLLVIVLHALGVIPIQINQTTKYMMYLVMGALFVIFVISGFLALKSSKKFEAMDVTEKAFLKEAKAWIQTITVDALDDSLSFDAETSDEMKYFKRIEKLKELLFIEYPDTEDELADKLAEDYYDTQFGTAFDATLADEMVLKKTQKETGDTASEQGDEQ